MMQSCRQDWLSRLLKIEGNVLDHLAEGRLKATMPLSFHSDRADFAPLEAFGRSMLGLAPWLEADADALDEDECALQAIWREKAIRCIDMATDPASPDFMNFTTGGQPLVDAAFLCHALVRAPKALAAALPERVRRNLAEALRSSRVITAGSNNWVFFTAMVEAGLHVLGEPYDMTRVLYALRVFQDWYVGDGVYGDGAHYHWDYYNSFVIQPLDFQSLGNLAKVTGEVRAERLLTAEHALAHSLEAHKDNSIFTLQIASQSP